ncbi:hypothetical protein CsSME_00034038 [Camellia sinensis var. sinensis]
MLGRNAMGKGEIQYESLSRFFSLAEIQSATNNFDDQMVIGVADSGKFIKGTSTMTEIEMLSQLWYTHLVALIEYCNDCNEMILVYEYIAHGTLADHLYKISTGGDGIGLTWDQRLNIFIDVKTTNILLDEKWVAKISDFGLSKGTTSFSKTHITTAIKDTFGF